MPDAFPGRLSPLQADLLRALAPEGSGLFLTGGAALIGFHGLARDTRDLDLFTRDPNTFSEAPLRLAAAARKVGADLEALRTHAAFRRFRVVYGNEATVVDLVLEPVPPVHPPEPVEGWHLAVDTLEEIAVNKVCAVVGRAEFRDLQDLWFLAGQGVDLDRALEEASVKDGGVGPDTLLFVLQDLGLGTLEIPGVDPEEMARLRAFFLDWMARLRLALLPEENPPG